MEWTPERIARFWAHESKSPGNYFTAQFGRRMARVIVPYIRDCHPALDYGCGPGFLIGHLAESGVVISGADFSPEAVAAANARNRHHPLFRGALSIRELRGLSQTFGAVIATETVEHMSDTALAAFFDDMRLLLVPGRGRLVITTPNEEDLSAAEIYCPACDHTFHRWQHVRSWSAATLTARLELEGFTPIATIRTNFASSQVRSWRTIAKRALGMADKPPHLMVVAETRSGGVGDSGRT